MSANPQAAAKRAIAGLRLTSRNVTPRLRHRSASAASTSNAQQPMNSKSLTSTTNGPGGSAAEAVSRISCRQLSWLNASTSPPALIITADSLRWPAALNLLRAEPSSATSCSLNVKRVANGSATSAITSTRRHTVVQTWLLLPASLLVPVIPPAIQKSSHLSLALVARWPAAPKRGE